MSVVEATEDILEKMQDVLEQVEEQEELLAEQERMIADRDEYIQSFSSPQRYVEMAVVVLMAYLYGAWFGVYMCPK